MQQRKAEIEAKRAKLAEIKQQRALRKEQVANRSSMGSPSEVGLLALNAHTFGF
jgi:dynein intermediate chain